MRPSDQKKLNGKFLPSETNQEEAVFDRLGFKLSNVFILKELIFKDLDIAGGGIIWWHKYLEMPKHINILVADQMHLSSSGIVESLLEGTLLESANKNCRPVTTKFAGSCLSIQRTAVHIFSGGFRSVTLFFG